MHRRIGIAAALAVALSTFAAAPQPPRKTAAAPATPPMSSFAATSRWVADQRTTPVPWQVWGLPAFEAARRAQRPMLVYVGQLGCATCTAMAYDTFSDAEIAKLLGSYFVPVLLDRDDHPLVAAAYDRFADNDAERTFAPTFVLAGANGEPLSATLATSGAELSRFLTVEANRWAEAPAELRKAGLARIAALAREADAPLPVIRSEPPALSTAIAERLSSGYDPAHGGFDVRLPRLLEAERVRALVDRARRADDHAARVAALGTLRAYLRSGAHDQLGGGFFRATLDSDRNGPLFEKRLSDQVALADALLSAFALTGEREFAAAARSTIDYVLRSLRLESGSFSALEDGYSLFADAPQKFLYGIYYAWQLDEIKRLVGERQAARVAEVYGMTPAGNVPEALDPYRTFTRRNLPRAAAPVPDDAGFVKARDLMLRERTARPRPAIDLAGDVAGTSGMVSVLVRASRELEEPRYAEAAWTATRALTSAWNPKTATLQHRIGRTGEGDALDYALFAAAMLDAWRATFDTRWLDLARAAQAALDAKFWSAADGVYSSRGQLPAGVATLAMPESDANAAAILLLTRLSALTGDAMFEQRALAVNQQLERMLAARPELYPRLAAARERLLDRRSRRLVILVGRRGTEATEGMRRVIDGSRSLDLEVASAENARTLTDLLRRMSWKTSLQAPDDPSAAVAYVCVEGTCSSAVTSPERLAALIP